MNFVKNGGGPLLMVEKKNKKIWATIQEICEPKLKLIVKQN